MPKPEETNAQPDPQRDKTDRPKPGIQPAEGDEETIEEDLKQKDQQQRRSGGGAT